MQATVTLLDVCEAHWLHQISQLAITAQAYDKAKLKEAMLSELDGDVLATPAHYQAAQKAIEEVADDFLAYEISEAVRDIEADINGVLPDDFDETERQNAMNEQMADISAHFAIDFELDAQDAVSLATPIIATLANSQDDQGVMWRDIEELEKAFNVAATKTIDVFGYDYSGYFTSDLQLETIYGKVVEVWFSEDESNTDASAFLAVADWSDCDVTAVSTTPYDDAKDAAADADSMARKYSEQERAANQAFENGCKACLDLQKANDLKRAAIAVARAKGDQRLAARLWYEGQAQRQRAFDFIGDNKPSSDQEYLLDSWNQAKDFV